MPSALFLKKNLFFQKKQRALCTAVLFSPEISGFQIPFGTAATKIPSKAIPSLPSHVVLVLNPAGRHLDLTHRHSHLPSSIQTALLYGRSSFILPSPYVGLRDPYRSRRGQRELYAHTVKALSSCCLQSDEIEANRALWPKVAKYRYLGCDDFYHESLNKRSHKGQEQGESRSEAKQGT